MLVSSHTVSCWASWDHVPKQIQDLFPIKEDGDFIIFVPDVVSGGVQLPDILKALNTGCGIKTSTGMAYVGKRSTQTP